MESDMHFLYFTKLSRKSQDFYFLVGIHLKPHPPHKPAQWHCRTYGKRCIRIGFPHVHLIWITDRCHILCYDLLKGFGEENPIMFNTFNVVSIAVWNNIWASITYDNPWHIWCELHTDIIFSVVILKDNLNMCILERETNYFNTFNEVFIV